MSHPDASARAARYARGVEHLTDRVLRALHSPTGLVVSQGWESDPRDPKTVLAAVRVVGPDLFAPALLAGAPFAPDDRAAVEEAFRVFPPAPGDAPEVALRDRATLALLARHGGSPPVPAMRVPVPEELDAGWREWREWSARMARLSPLALPGLDTRVHDQADRRVRCLSRGTTRAMLRRDHPTAARLARWLALSQSRGVAPDMDVGAVLGLLEVCGGSARTALDLAIARFFMLRREAGTA